MIKICEECGKKHKTSYKHLCNACYRKKRYHGSAEVRAKSKSACDKWRANNLERFNAICKKAAKKYWLRKSTEYNQD